MEELEALIGRMDFWLVDREMGMLVFGILESDKSIVTKLILKKSAV